MKNKYNMINDCEVCGNTSMSSVLNLGLHPMCDDLKKIGEASYCNEYPIEILFCEVCKTAHQKYQVPKKILFPEDYHYRARFTTDVLKGMEDLVECCVKSYKDLNDQIVLDVGCNDGSLLKSFKNHGVKTIGIEPTGACKDAHLNVDFAYQEYFSPAIANKIVEMHGCPKVIMFTNVFAHIENLKDVIDSLKILMNDDTKLVIENHYLGAVFEKNQFDTFYHEHPRTYSLTSFQYIAESLGCVLENVMFPSRYGGNIRVFIGSGLSAVNDVELERVKQREEKFTDDFKDLKENVYQWIALKKTLIKKYNDKFGPIRAKAFPGRAAILVKMLGLDHTMISEVFEKPGSMKIGHYLPGTKIPIRSDDDLFSSDDNQSPILNLAWHISKEIRAYLKSNNFQGEIIDILSQEDFILDTV